MTDFRLPADRVIDSTDTNEFATGVRDETLLDEDIVQNVPIDDTIPDGVDELEEGERPIYNEDGFSDDLI